MLKTSNRRAWTGFLGIAVLLVSIGQSRAEEARPLNEKLVNITPNRWLTLHELKRGDKGYFRRQAHGGSCFDTKRGRLVLFGSDTHGKDWLNAPRTFDPVTTTWSQPYVDDPRSTYTVNAEGIPVAGAKGDHPWTTHTFGGVLYDDSRDEVVVVCHPGHMIPGRFTDSVKDLWPKVKRHPTWSYAPAKGTWTALPCKPVSFFPFAAAFDSDRKVVIGYRSDGIYELGGKVRKWTKVVAAGRGMFGYHNNAVYDSKQKALIAFGTNRNSNDVVAYWPAKKTHRKMPTPGARPPKDQHCPMAFEPVLARTVIVIDRVDAPAGASPAQRRKAKTRAEVWLYDLAADAWQTVPTATLPKGCGMNYNMEYDPHHKVLLLVTGSYGTSVTVRALRIDPKTIRDAPATPKPNPAPAK